MTLTAEENKLRLLFIGQAPSRESDSKPPFVGKCGKFLAELMGVTHQVMLADHDFVNVLDYWPGKGIGGDLFPMKEAKKSAQKILAEVCPGRAVVLLGNNVAKAFEVKAFRYLELYQVKDPTDPTKVLVPLLTVVPHPSQVSRHWNKIENRLAASKFLRSLTEARLEKQPR